MPLPPQEIRKVAASAIESMVRRHGDIVPWSTIAAGFQLGDERILFANRVRGIFKPAQLDDGAALSIKTSRPSRKGRAPRYNDELIQDGLLRYCFQGESADSADNRLLLQAWQRHLPLIYFSGLADSVYQIFFPVFITQYDPIRKEAIMAWKTPTEINEGDFVLSNPHHVLGRRTATNQLQHARFRGNVLAAYGFRCAISRLQVGNMLKAVSLVSEKDAPGIPPVNNAVCMSVLHQAAFDANLLGINHRGEVKAGRLLDDPHYALLRKQLGETWAANQVIAFPKAPHLRPSRDCLAARFKQFEEAQVA